MTISELEQAAQRAAEARLAAATDALFDESDAFVDLAGPYCGCDTCVVREVIDAAWPYLKELAAVVESADTPDSNSGPEMGTGSSPVGGTHSDYEEVQRLRRAIMQHRFDYMQDISKSEGDWRYADIQSVNRKLWNSL